ncbi:hypothetical protein DID88_003416 [Monilinia fructigena]|uniref:Uncharacterized protein n=1 Tax=Monilinia fructigena TaxID=38457 RepID=A0A395IUF2_9HELO|nr:hypothetical protein DID88_003416 [Monilinia fructigena]
MPTLRWLNFKTIILLFLNNSTLNFGPSNLPSILANSISPTIMSAEIPQVPPRPNRFQEQGNTSSGTPSLGSNMPQIPPRPSIDVLIDPFPLLQRASHDLLSTICLIHTTSKVILVRHEQCQQLNVRA